MENGGKPAEAGTKVGVKRGGVVCRSCGARELDLLLSLGRTPLANSLLSVEDLAQVEPRYPLELAFCAACALLQITEMVSPEKLFRHYLYYSSVSPTIVENARALTERLIAERSLGDSDFVVELASNDGYLLKNYMSAGIPVLGVEPALNVAAAAAEAGIPTLPEFFGLEVAERLVAAGRRATVIHANNVLAHVPDLNGFVAGIAKLLSSRGVAVIEVPYVRELIDRCEFDTIYHEHLCYFSLTSLVRLTERHGLAITDVERIAIHGGSLRLYLTPAADGVEANPSVGALLREESINQLHRIEYYRNFASQVRRTRSRLLLTLRQLKADGARIAAYGAAAKGSTLLSYCEIGRETLDYVVDRSPHKQGLYMPGNRLPILPTEKLLEDQPDFVLLLSWNFADEIFAQQSEYIARGGHFIVPVPEPRILPAASAEPVEARRAS